MRYLILSLLILLGCGYKWVGLSTDMKEISLGPIEGIREEPGFSSTLREAIREEFQSRGIRVLEETRFRLQGRVEGIGLETVSYDRSAYTKQYRVLVTVRMELLEGGRIKWQGKLSRSKVLTLSGDAVLDESRKEALLRDIAKDLAEELYLRLAMETCPREGSQ
ncbi:MAG: hypothetical protein DRG31_02555 [Deltaproteobacteria bacterium]|nr:MAG: hypothetical protein DRG31_02555 [Deltaproteobacteria bacterium]